MNRIEPAGPVGAYKTYQISAPPATHFRPATCEEVGCNPWRFGWRTTLAADDPRCDYIRSSSGRRFIEERVAGEPGTTDGMIAFTFEPGQMCFQASTHRAPIGREPLYIVRDGDFRGNPTGRRMQHVNGEDWVDDFVTHTQRIVDARERG